jgi:hypothetical protein
MSKCKRTGSIRVSSRGNIFRETDKCKKDFDIKKRNPNQFLQKFSFVLIFQFLYWTTLVLDESFNHLSILSMFQLALISILILYSLVIYFIVFFSCPLSSVSSFTCQFHYVTSLKVHLDMPIIRNFNGFSLVLANLLDLPNCIDCDSQHKYAT